MCSSLHYYIDIAHCVLGRMFGWYKHCSLLAEYGQFYVVAGNKIHVWLYTNYFQCGFDDLGAVTSAHFGDLGPVTLP